MRFLPFEDAEASLEPSIREAEALCAALRRDSPFVYLFNSPGTPLLHTLCPVCGRVLYRRDFYGPMGARLMDAAPSLSGARACGGCGAELPFTKGEAFREAEFREGDFLGGYPFTRPWKWWNPPHPSGGADRGRVVRAWEEVLTGDGLMRLHREVPHPESYPGRCAGSEPTWGSPGGPGTCLVPGRPDGPGAPRRGLRSQTPRAYFAMGKALFALKGERLEKTWW
jgi:hypothetical protein